MENASKALLIAGAILIAILLIAIGMMVFNSASGVIDTAASGMTDHQKTMHNKKFTIYEGTKSGSTVLELVEVAKTNNANDDAQDVTMKMGTTNLLSDSSSIVRAKQYEISCPTDSSTGVVKDITVTAK